MISRIRGQLEDVRDEQATVSVNGIFYEVLVPPGVSRRLKSVLEGTGPKEVTLHTFHYIESSGPVGNQLPRLIGFLDANDRDFFRVYIQAMGPRKALRSLAVPVRDIAVAIERGDKEALSSLPQIGPRIADQIIANLRGKVTKWALLRGGEPLAPKAAELVKDIRKEAREILLQLQYSAAEADELVAKVLSRRSSIKSSEELIKEIFKQQAVRGPKENPEST